MKKLILLALALVTTSSTLMLTANIAHSQVSRTIMQDFDLQRRVIEQEKQIKALENQPSNNNYLAKWNEAIARNPRSPEAWIDRGIAKEKNGTISDLRSAISDYSKAISLNPEFALAYGIRANLRIKLRNRSGAIADYRQAARLFRQQGDTENVKTTIGFLRELGVDE